MKAMSLVEDYLRAVSALLPKAQRDDIVAELRDVILSRIEGKEAELGRSLGDEEVEAVLHEVGHPLVVSARYGEGQQSLVGPALYPYWVFGVKVAITLQVAGAMIVLIVMIFTHGDVAWALGHAFRTLTSGVIMIVGFATIAAWIIERRKVKIDYLDRWRVKDLRVLELAAWNSDMVRDRLVPGVLTHPVWTRRGSSVISRGISCIATGAILTLWWVGAIRFGWSSSPKDWRGAGLEPGLLTKVDWAALRAMLYWPVIGYGLLTIAQGIVCLARSSAIRLQGVMDVLVGLATCAIIGWIWFESPLSPAVRIADVRDLLSAIREMKSAHAVLLAPIFSISLLGWGVAGLCILLRGLWEILTPQPTISSPVAHPAGVR